MCRGGKIECVELHPVQLITITIPLRTQNTKSLLGTDLRALLLTIKSNLGVQMQKRSVS